MLAGVYFDKNRLHSLNTGHSNTQGQKKITGHGQLRLSSSGRRPNMKQNMAMPHPHMYMTRMKASERMGQWWVKLSR